MLSDRFKMVDIGTLSWFLGIDFKVEKDSITMSQSTYLSNVLSKFKMQDIKGVKTTCEEFVIEERSDIISNT